MSSFLMLTKLEFSRTFANLFNRKNRKSKPKPLLFVLLALGLLFVGVSFIYNFAIIGMLVYEDLPLEIGIKIFASLASMMTFVSSVNHSKSIYIGEDYDLLITLPLKKRDIISSKLFAFYMTELLFSAITMIPCGIVIIILTQNVKFMLLAFLLAFFIPIVPLTIASIFSLLVTMLVARFRHANIISFLLYFLFITSLSMAGFFINTGKGAAISAMGDVIKWFNPSLLFVELAISDSMLYILIFIGINIVVFALTVVIFSLAFSKLHDLVTSIKMKNTYVRKQLKIKDEFKTLFGIEIKRLVNSKMYLINSIIGAIMAIVSTTLTLISTRAVREDPNAIYYYDLLIGPIGILVLMFIISISNPSCCAISMEGKNFWMSKTLPISLKKYMKAKLLITYIFHIPASIICSTVIVIFYHNDVFACIMTYLIPIVMVLISGVIGLTMNVKHPKFKWKNEQEVVKNSVSVLFTMLFGFLISTNVGAITISLIALVNVYVGYSVGLALLVIILIICYSYLNKIFVKRIEDMEDF